MRPQYPSPQEVKRKNFVSLVSAVKNELERNRKPVTREILASRMREGGWQKNFVQRHIDAAMDGGSMGEFIYKIYIKFYKIL